MYHTTPSTNHDQARTPPCIAARPTPPIATATLATATSTSTSSASASSASASSASSLDVSLDVVDVARDLRHAIAHVHPSLDARASERSAVASAIARALVGRVLRIVPPLDRSRIPRTRRVARGA